MDHTSPDLPRLSLSKIPNIVDDKAFFLMKNGTIWRVFVYFSKSNSSPTAVGGPLIPSSFSQTVPRHNTEMSGHKLSHSKPKIFILMNRTLLSTLRARKLSTNKRCISQYSKNWPLVASPPFFVHGLTNELRLHLSFSQKFVGRGRDCVLCAFSEMGTDWWFIGQSQNRQPFRHKNSEGSGSLGTLLKFMKLWGTPSYFSRKISNQKPNVD